MISVIKRKNFISVCVLFLIIMMSFYFVFKKATYSINIDEILKTNNYSYLNEEAKNYIKRVYNETGVVLLTEKNKEKNTPYLNPEYVKYLEHMSLNGEDVSSLYDVIPNETIIDYVYLGMSMFNNNELPSTYDLRDVDGMNFVSPVKNQGGSGLCWAFATNAQAESYLLVKNNTSYEKGISQLFSESQIDHATASNGVIDGTSLYSFNRILGEGGTFDYATNVMMDGLGLVDINWNSFDPDDTSAMEKNKIYKYFNSKYDVLSTVDYPSLDLSTLDLSNEIDVEKRNSYLTNLKLLIMQYGGAYVSTSDPISRCSISVNGFRLLYDDDKCASGGHAMQVIGWDDNLEYSFCSGQKDSQHYYYLGNSNNCSNGTVITGKGAWLIKNSWGSSQPYVYLAYDSMNSVFNIITGMDKQNWDNNYLLKTSGSNIIKTTYTNDTGVLEKLNKVKVHTIKQYVDYNVCVSDSDNTFNKCYELNTDFPGIYTVDFSNDNILIEKDLVVKISSSEVYALNKISLYTDNVDDEIYISTDDVYFKNKLTNVNKYIMRVSSKTKNIPEDAIIDYKILDIDRNEIMFQYSYTENIVFANQVFSKIEIDSNLEIGTYILQTIYDGKVICESKLVVDDILITVEGSGTEEDPYIINTPSQLNLVRLDRFAFYKLGQDIDLTYDTQNEKGLFYNDGKGWEPIRYSSYNKSNSHYLFFSKGFSGGFDGNNHKIIGLYINRPNEDGIGLFANTYNENYSNLYIKNIFLENPMIVGNDFVGSLLGVAYGTTYERQLDISNIQIHGGFVKGNNYVGGVIGIVNAGSHLKIYGTSIERHTISNLYNSASITSNGYAGGIFGMVTNIKGYAEEKSPVKIFDVLNKGSVTSLENAAGISGYIIARDTNDISISNSMSTGIIKGDNCSSNIVCEFSDDSVGNLNLNNIYYIGNETEVFNNTKINLKNVEKKDMIDIKSIDSYSLWDSFDDNWKLETVNEITRMPILKFVDFEYLTMNNIELFVGDNVNISNYIKPNIDAALNNDYIINDNKIISINNENVLVGESIGNTEISVISYYDGYENTISVKVNNVLTESTITFDSNGGSIVESITDKIGNSVIEPVNPVKEGYNFMGWYLDNDTFLNKYEFDVMPESNVLLYAKWEKITIKVNNYNIENNMIKNIKPNSSIRDYLMNFEYDERYKVEFYNYDDELIGDLGSLVITGSKVKFYDGSALIAEYLNIINGDVNRDGILNIDDILLSSKHMVRGDVITDSLCVRAIDIDSNGVININDIIKMIRKIQN